MTWHVDLQASPFGVGTTVRVKDSPIHDQIARAGAVLPGSNGKVKVLLEGDRLCSLFQPDQLEPLTETTDSKVTAMLAALQEHLSDTELDSLWQQLGALLGGAFESSSQKTFRPLTDGKKQQSPSARSSRRFAATGWIKHGRDTKNLKDGPQPYNYVAYAWVQHGKERSKRFPKHLEQEVDTLINQGKTRSDSDAVVHEILQFINCEAKAPKRTRKQSSSPTKRHHQAETRSH